MAEELLIKMTGAFHHELHPSYSSVTPVKVLQCRSMLFTLLVMGKKLDQRHTEGIPLGGFLQHILCAALIQRMTQIGEELREIILILLEQIRTIRAVLPQKLTQRIGFVFTIFAVLFQKTLQFRRRRP